MSTDRSLTLRGIAMLMIVLVHAINEYPAFMSLPARLLLVPSWGELGCSVFFFVSGYGMYLATTRRQREGTLTWAYLGHKIWGLYLPFFIAAGATLAVLLAAPIMGASHIPATPITSSGFLLRTLTLTLPDGNELWFLKTILAFYLLQFALCRICPSSTPAPESTPPSPTSPQTPQPGHRQRPLGSVFGGASAKPLLSPLVVWLTITTLLAIGIMAAVGLPRYWYVSNICFPLGAYIASRDQQTKRTHLDPIFDATTSVRSLAVSQPILWAILFALCAATKLGHISHPILTIVSCMAFTMFLYSLHCRAAIPGPILSSLQFIGRHSICYYLFEVATMYLIPSTSMPWPLFFVLNMALLTLAAWAYSRATALTPTP